MRVNHSLSCDDTDVTGNNEYRLARSGSKQQPNLVAGYKASTAKQVVQYVVIIPQQTFRQVTRRPQKCSVSVIVQLSM